MTLRRECLVVTYKRLGNAKQGMLVLTRLQSRFVKNKPYLALCFGPQLHTVFKRSYNVQYTCWINNHFKYIVWIFKEVHTHTQNSTKGNTQVGVNHTGHYRNGVDVRTHGACIVRMLKIQTVFISIHFKQCSSIFISNSIHKYTQRVQC